MVLMIWAALQLTWVTMLLFVQLVQISRALTTYENMKGADYFHGSAASNAITSALATGTMSMGAAQLGSAGRGPDPAVHMDHGHGHSHGHGGHNHDSTGCFAQWKKILGVDTFVETARHGYEGDNVRSRRNRNPFSRGCVRNCKDFWCDPAPLFGGRENGEAMLDGSTINYTSMYDTPLPMTIKSRRTADGGGAYASVAADEAV